MTLPEPYHSPNKFQEATPFPHMVFDGLWNPYTLLAAANEFPPPEDRRWVTYPQPEEVGKRAGGREMWGKHTHLAFGLFTSPSTITFLQSLTGISPLTPDDIGGGMHLSPEGARLDMHVDFNLHPTNGLERRLNMLVFLNQYWEKDWGGVLYLGEHREVEVMPLFNRTVIFETSDHSWHGHPDPVKGNHLRKSLAVYFYAPVRDADTPAHTTIFRKPE